ncbi:MAG: hypothetical protein QF569_28550 [Candidatus Poribacteria bacterium]|nr:hypothetical protein [Candidatus Poribacteria bacterium]
MFEFATEPQQAVEQRFERVEERTAAWSVIDSLPQSAFRWILADKRVATVSSRTGGGDGGGNYGAISTSIRASESLPYLLVLTS